VCVLHIIFLQQCTIWKRVKKLILPLVAIVRGNNLISVWEHQGLCVSLQLYHMEKNTWNLNIYLGVNQACATLKWSWAGSSFLIMAMGHDIASTFLEFCGTCCQSSSTLSAMAVLLVTCCALSSLGPTMDCNNNYVDTNINLSMLKTLNTLIFYT
jgi:hypothetical protein